MGQVFCKLLNTEISQINKEVFCALEEYIITSGHGSDKDGFEVIKERLKHPPTFNAPAFAEEVIYVILASGFRQKVAKEKFTEIMNFIHTHNTSEITPENLLPIFGNINKIRAICKVWHNQQSYRNGFYEIPTTDIDARLNYLETLPYIGKITRNHIARNLGLNKVKYDIWIQRLGITLYGCGKEEVSSPIHDNVRKACDTMFTEISTQTGLPIGYIDVVLWKACQIKILCP